jgi:hypothetical protein
MRGLHGACGSGYSRAPGLRSVFATINYTRPIAERLHIDVRDCARTNMLFEPHALR